MSKKAGLLVLVVLALLAFTASVSAQVPPRCADPAGAPIPCTPTPDPGNGGTGSQPSADDPDGDGIVNTFDACPNEGGPSNNSGCPMGPDADGDGTSDDRDVCPTEGGPASNNGCPESTIVATVTPVPGGAGSEAPLPALPEGETCVVSPSTSQGANYRGSTTVNQGVLQVLSAQNTYPATAIVLNEGETWYFLPNVGGQSGFAAGSALRTNSACASLPVFGQGSLDGLNLGLDLRRSPDEPIFWLQYELENVLISSMTDQQRAELNPALMGPDDLHICMYNPDFGAITCGDEDDPSDPTAFAVGNNFVCYYNKGVDEFVCLDDFTNMPDESEASGFARLIHPFQCYYNKGADDFVCLDDLTAAPQTGQFESAQAFICRYNESLGEFICLDDFTAAPSEDPTAGAEGLIGPQDIGMCLYHPDYGAVICERDPDGTFDPAAAEGVNPSGPDDLRLCVYSPDHGRVVCDLNVIDGAGRVGRLNILCDTATGECQGHMATAPEDTSGCPEVRRGPVYDLQSGKGGLTNAPTIDLSSFAAVAPDADPCAVNTYTFIAPIDQILAEPPEVVTARFVRRAVLYGRKSGDDKRMDY